MGKKINDIDERVTIKFNSITWKGEKINIYHKTNMCRQMDRWLMGRQVVHDR